MYLATKRATIDSSTAQMLYRTVAELEAYGVTIPPKIREALEASKVNMSKINDMRSSTDPETAASAAVDKLARGEGDAAEVLAAAAASTLISGDIYSPLSGIYRSAEAKVGKIAHGILAEDGNAWITKTLRPHVQAHVKTILDAIPETLEINPDRQPKQMEFLYHMPAVADAWARLQGIYTAARSLRRVGVIPNYYRSDDLYEYAGTSDVRGLLTAGDITTFCWATQHGLTPGLYTEEEATK